MNQDQKYKGEKDNNKQEGGRKDHIYIISCDC